MYSELDNARDAVKSIGRAIAQVLSSEKNR